MTKKYVLLLGIFVALYVLITFNTPPDPTSLQLLGISVLQLRLINLSFLIPVVAIWFLAFYGFSTVKDYALKITGNPDGRAFNKLASGLMVLGFTLPMSSIISASLNYLTRAYPDFIAASVITNRYISLILAALAITLIYQGSKGLVALVIKDSVRPNYLWCAIVAVIMGGVYAYLALTNMASSTPDPDTNLGIYYLPSWLIVTTIIIPHICIWYFGLKSAVLILFYKKRVQGILYARALSRLAAGIGIVVCSSMVSQLFTAVSTQFVKWGVQPLLAFAYVLVVITGIGYVLIALGAKKLKKIEEV